MADVIDNCSILFSNTNYACKGLTLYLLSKVVQGLRYLVAHTWN